MLRRLSRFLREQLLNDRNLTQLAVLSDGQLLKSASSTGHSMAGGNPVQELSIGNLPGIVDPIDYGVPVNMTDFSNIRPQAKALICQTDFVEGQASG